MKQHITVQQLNELSPMAERELIKWYWDTERYQLGDIIACPCSNENHGVWHEYMYGSQVKPDESYFDRLSLPLLSIGQMIEFLKERDKIVKLVRGDGGLRTMNIYWKMEEEICDILWETCKEILEK